MGVIASKTYGTVGLSFTDSLTCSDAELYKTTPLFIHSFELVRQEQTPVPTIHFVKERDVSISITPRNGRAALIYDSRSDSGYILYSGNLNTCTFNMTLYDDEYIWGPYTGMNGYPGYPNFEPNGGSGLASTNIPVFATEEEAFLYLEAEGEEQAHIYLSAALNYKKSEYNPEETRNYRYSCKHGNVDLVRGTITPVSDSSWHTLLFQANTRPAFYITEDGFSMNLIAPDVIASIYVAGPESVVDNIPESQWTEGALAYNGPFYASLSTYIQATGTTPEDGTYTYPVDYNTNIPVFGSREDAEEAIATGDYSKSITPVREYDVKIGDEEDETTFGGGGFMSPFFTILSGSKSDLKRLADFLFTDDQSLWEDIKKGLEMYGSNPIDYIIGCRAYPFNVANVTNESPRYDIWFGSYMKHFDSPFNEVINLAHKYIDAGSFYCYPIQYCYLDFEPYTTLSAYFPYHGWEQLDMKKYYKKTVNVRYYVDIISGQALIVTLCDGVLCDQFGPFEIGTELPLTGANYAQWAQGQVRLLTQAASSVLGGVAGGATSGNVAGFAANSLTGLIPASQALHEAKQQGGPKNTMITKGNFGSNIGNYLPGYVIFRFDIHEMLEPDLLQSLAGRPSYSSGNIRSFSGFVSGKVVKLDTSGMTENEAAAIRGMIQTGIYV